MEADVLAKLEASSRDFLRVVWPAIKPACGGGQVIPVEAVSATSFAKSLDRLGGVDAWQVKDGVGIMRGIASRIQWGRAYNTFTIRHALVNGGRTEFAKRLIAIDHSDQGWLCPAITVQAYLTCQGGNLVTVGLTRTRDLIQYVRQGREGRDDGDWFTRDVSNATFICVPWDRYERSGQRIHVLKNNHAWDACQNCERECATKARWPGVA